MNISNQSSTATNATNDNNTSHLGVNVGTSLLTSASNNAMHEQLRSPFTINGSGNQAAKVSPPTEEKDSAAMSVANITADGADSNTNSVAHGASTVRRLLDADAGSKSEENASLDASSKESDDERKPSAKLGVNIGQKRSHVASLDDAEEEDDRGSTNSPTKKLRSDLLDLSLSEESSAYIDALVSTGAMPGPAHASLSGTRPSLRSSVRESVWEPTTHQPGSARSRRASQRQSSGKIPKGKKSKPQPLPMNQNHALKLLRDKEKAIKGMSTKARKSGRKAILRARMLHHAGRIFDKKSDVSSYGGQQTNFGYQLYRLIRPELTYEENEDLNWEDIALVSDDFFGLSGGVSMDDLEEVYQAEKKKERDN